VGTTHHDNIIISRARIEKLIEIFRAYLVRRTEGDSDVAEDELRFDRDGGVDLLPVCLRLIYRVIGNETPCLIERL
jgi:hypothetical protein